MHAIPFESVRHQLEDRRRRLTGALGQHPGERLLVSLLEQVDSALANLGSSDYGLCLVCREHVSEADLARNPLARYCLCDLSPEQQRALESDLQLATRIQSALLPDPDLAFGPWQAHYRYEPAGPVSGDYCDLWVHPEDGDTVFFAVGDVSGKGVAASLLMAHLHAAFRSLLGAGLPLPELVCRVNDQLMQASIPSHYATLACGRAGLDGRIELVNAGHCPPLLLRDGQVREVPATGLPIGLFGDRSYETERLELRPGDTLVLYTDGLSEARRPDGAEFGAAGVERHLRDRKPTSARELVESLRGSLDGFLGQDRPGDDLTLLALRHGNAT